MGLKGDNTYPSHIVPPENVVFFLHLLHIFKCINPDKEILWELSGRVLYSGPKGRRFEPYQRHCVVSLSKNINPSLVLVQPRKTCPFITEKLLMGRKESNQTNKRKIYERKIVIIFLPITLNICFGRSKEPSH